MSFFRFCMRHGARILFAAAAIQVVVALAGWLWAFAHGGRTWNSYDLTAPGENLLIQTSLVIMSLSSALLPFFGALVIDRLDRWLASRDKEAGR